MSALDLIRLPKLLGPCHDRRDLAQENVVARSATGMKRAGAGETGTRPTGTFQDRTSTDRILHAVFIHEDRSRGIGTPLSLTHDS